MRAEEYAAVRRLGCEEQGLEGSRERKAIAIEDGARDHMVEFRVSKICCLDEELNRAKTIVAPTPGFTHKTT